MFDILMGLPLFRGVTRDRMAETVGMAKFHFLKYLPGETIVSAGDPCAHIKFVISGKVRMTVENADRRFKVASTLGAPDVLAPSFLFGRATDYPCTVKAIEDTSILQITKQDYLRILNSDTVFMLNFLNMLSVNAQKSVDGVLALTTGSMEERIAFWIVALTQPGADNIVLSCRHRDLYSFFGVQRSSFIATLEGLREKGLISYHGNEIEVNSRKDMLDMLADRSLSEELPD